MIDPSTDWYVRLRIAEAFEGLATELRRNVWPITAESVAQAIDNHVSKMRGRLQREADREAREIEDAAR